MKMNYKELKWGALKSYAKTLGINTKGLKRFEIEQKIKDLNVVKVEYIDDSNLKEFKGVKQSHPFFEEVEPYIPYLKAFNKIGSVSNIEGISKGIAEVFMKYIETDKNATIDLSCGRCMPRYYKRLVAGYNRMADEYGRDNI